MQYILLLEIFCDQESKRLILLRQNKIGTALSTPNLPWIIFAKSTWTLIACQGFHFIFDN